MVFPVPGPPATRMFVPLRIPFSSNSSNPGTLIFIHSGLGKAAILGPFLRPIECCLFFGSDLAFCLENLNALHRNTLSMQGYLLKVLSPIKSLGNKGARSELSHLSRTSATKRFEFEITCPGSLQVLEFLSSCQCLTVASITASMNMFRSFIISEFMSSRRIGKIARLLRVRMRAVSTWTNRRTSGLCTWASSVERESKSVRSYLYSL